MFRRNEWFLAAPVLFLAWYFTVVFRAQVGFRYALVVLPLLFVFTGSLLSEAAALGRPGRWVAGALVAYLVASVLSYYPHFIPYFNELVWDRTRAYKIMADSSLVLDQNHWYVRRYLRQHPDVVFEPDAPTAGRCSCAWSDTWVCTTSSSSGGSGRTSSPSTTWPTGTSCSG